MTAEDMDHLGQQLIRIGSMIRMHGRGAFGKDRNEQRVAACLLMAAVNEFNYPDCQLFFEMTPKNGLPILPCIVRDMRVGNRRRSESFSSPLGRGNQHYQHYRHWMDHAADHPRPLIVTLQPK